jgi:hypothetical protein
VSRRRLMAKEGSKDGLRVRALAGRLLCLVGPRTENVR